MIDAKELELLGLKKSIQSSFTVESIITQIGTVTKKDLPVDPSWQDLKENV